MYVALRGILLRALLLESHNARGMVLLIPELLENILSFRQK